MSRVIVRVFDGRASAHVGPYRDEAAAQMKADQLARAAKRRGLSVSVSVRPLLPGKTPRAKVLDAMSERPRYSARSYAGRKEGE